MFARFGLPQQVVSDNGPQFTSEQFSHFMAVNGVKHIRTSPSSNGAAERLVQTVKRGLQCALREGLSLDQALQAFLLRYRSTPHTTTGATPSSLMLGRDLRTQLDLLWPEVAVRVGARQNRQREQHDQHSHHRELGLGQLVWRPGERWVKGTVHEQLGPVSYQVWLENGELWRRHIDHLRARCSTTPTTAISSQCPDSYGCLVDSGSNTTDQAESRASAPVEPTARDTDHDVSLGDSLDSSPSPAPRRYPTRVRCAPERLYAHLEGAGN